MGVARGRVSGVWAVSDADDLEELHANVQDAVRCHFDKDKKPKMIRLHFAHEVM